MRKTMIWVSDQVQHKLACKVTEDSYKLSVSDLKRGIILSMEQDKGADKLFH